MSRMVSLCLSKLYHSVHPVTWWPGKLRPFESYRSFQEQFCSLNRISKKRFIQYFANSYTVSGAVNVNRFSALANEHESAIKCMLDTSRDLDGYGPFSVSNEKSRKIFRYCSQCIQFGYHSYLHELMWLKLCPFHLISLQEAPSTRYIEIMKSSCIDWPLNIANDSLLGDSENNAYAKLIVSWGKNVFSKTRELSDKEVWGVRGYEDLLSENVQHSFGRLCSVEKLPKLLEPIVIEYAHWSCTETKFSRAENESLSKCLSEFPIDWVYRHFKIACGHSKKLVKFVRRSKTMLSRLASRHNHANCSWDEVSSGWYRVWLERDASINYYNCPYNLAIKMMITNWGRVELVVSPQKRTTYQSDFFDLTNILRDQGFFNCSLDTANTEDRAFKFGANVLCSCEWVEGPLSSALGRIASCELDVEFMTLQTWLGDIDRGASPWDRYVSLGSVRLLNLGEKFILLKWKVLSHHSRNNSYESISSITPV